MIEENQGPIRKPVEKFKKEGIQNEIRTLVGDKDVSKV